MFRHSLGLDALAATVRDYPPEHAAAICQVSAEDIREAARIIGRAERLPHRVPQLDQRRSRRRARRAVDLDELSISPYAPPTNAMQMFRYAEQGSIGMLWVSCTNPAASLPELERIRSILAQDRLFLVVQDIFLTETAQYADVVLPAAAWDEKTGTFTTADRTVHLSEQAVDPPARHGRILTSSSTSPGGSHARHPRARRSTNPMQRQSLTPVDT